MNSTRANLPVLTDVVELEVIDMDAALRKHWQYGLYAEAKPYVAPEPQHEIILKARKISVVRPTLGKSQITALDFDASALELCTRFLNKNIELLIEDENGLFRAENPQVIRAFKAIGTKLLISTENQK